MPKNIWLNLSIFIGFLFLLTSYIPNFYEASIANLLPADRVMTPAEHMYTYDYNVYLSKIKQGAEGRWTVVDKYTNDTDQKGVLLQMLYLLAGKIFGPFGMSPGLIFHLLRTVLSSVWILTIIYLNFYFFAWKHPRGESWPKEHLGGGFIAFIGVLFSLFAASWPVFYQYQNSTWIGMHMSWWQELDVLKRISYIPHYTLNYILISVLTILLSQYQKSNIKDQNDRSNIKNKSMKQWNPTPLKLRGAGNEAIYQYSNITIIGIVLFFSFFIHPSSGLLFLISWVLYHAFNTIFQRSLQLGRILKTICYTLILLAVCAVPLLYFQYVTSSYPWKSLTDYDKLNRLGVNVKEYILALGPVFFTGVAGGIIVLIKKEQKYLPLVTWIFGAFLAIFAFKKFPLQSELRFVQTANHIPLAILSVYLLIELRSVINKFLTGGERGIFRQAQDKEKHASSDIREGISRQNLSKIIIYIILFIIIAPIIILGFAQSYFSIKAQTDFIHQRVVAGQPLVPFPPQVMYPLKDMYEAFIWLDKNTKNKEIVLSHIYAGNYIPAYSGNYVYLGHNPETPDYKIRINKLEKFYSGTMPNWEAQKFLKDEKISYVLYGPQELEKSAENIKKYEFLKEVFNSNWVKLYKAED